MHNNEKYKTNGYQKTPIRTPLHKQKPLMIEQEPGYKYYILNDVPGIRQKFELAGWEAVQDKSANKCDVDINKGAHLGSELKLHVNMDPAAKVHTATVMRIKQEWYDEDFADRMKELDLKEQSIDPALNSVNGSTYGSLKRETDREIIN